MLIYESYQIFGQKWNKRNTDTGTNEGIIHTLYSLRNVSVYLQVLWLGLCSMFYNSQESFLVRAPDSESKGCKFESWQKGRENFLLRGQLCVLTLIRCPFHPCVTTVAHKRPRSFCQKCRWQVTPRHTYTLGAGWVCHCPGRVWGSIRKWAHMQLIREHPVTVVSGCWATVDWSWSKELN